MKANYKTVGCIIFVVCFILSVWCIRKSTEANRWSATLIAAIHAGDTTEALSLIAEGTKNGYNFDTPDTPNHWINRLLESAPNTPLPVACRKGDVAVVKALLQAGANPKNPQNTNWSAHMALLLNPYCDSDYQIIEMLIHHGADISSAEADMYPILQSVNRIPRRYLGKANEVTGSYYSEECDETIACGITEVFTLLAQNCDYKVVDAAGRNALHYAALHGNEYLAVVLIEKYGFDPNVEDFSGMTAFEIAVKNGYTGFVKILSE